MSRPIGLYACMAFLLAASFVGARAETACPIPDHLQLGTISLPRARVATAQQHKLVVLTLGGAATIGQVAGDPNATYPARLQAELGQALPGVDVLVLNKATPAGPSSALLPDLAKVIAQSGIRLVIWATGAREAAHSIEIEDYINSLQSGIALIHQAGADVILLDPQYAPSIARITNTAPYREALHGTAAASEVPVLHRYDLMMQWNDDGVMDLDARGKVERQAVARHLFACIAAALAPAIVQAVK